MKSKLPVIFAFALAASSALPFAATAADKSGQTGAGTGATGTSSGVGSSASSSASTGGPDLSLFQQLDTNKDGYVDQQEANKSAQTKADFKALDANADGKISADEWAGASKKQ
jgi:hypothetical protein